MKRRLALSSSPSLHPTLVAFSVIVNAMYRGGVLGAADVNTSLDASMLAGGGGDLNTTARLEARKSLSSSHGGRGSLFRGGAVPSAKKPAFGVGRPSLAVKENADKCVRGKLFCLLFPLCWLLPASLSPPRFRPLASPPHPTIGA